MSQHTISVLEETLDVTFPTECVRICCAQPFIQLRHPIQEPFPVSAECESKLLQGVDRVIDSAMNCHPQFIVFPEFSIPGIAGVQRLVNALQSETIRNSTVLIGGVTSLSNREYASLCELAGVDVNVAPANAPFSVSDGFWINTSVTIAKTDDGTLQMWLQPKISPSWSESKNVHQRMFKGQSLHLFRAQFDDGLPCHFFSQLCYDWIGHENGIDAPTALLQHFNESCRTCGSQQSLNWVFVLQHNPYPNDDTFLSAAREFLTNPEFSFVHRDDTAIVMACTASSLLPARNGPYGFSSVILNPRAPFDTRACPSTFTTSGQGARSSTALRRCIDAVFREMGECIHVYDIRNPRRVVPDATDRTLPLENARVLSFSDRSTDPRLSGSPVPAVVKWVNDELDHVSDIASECLAACPLHEPVERSQTQVVLEHRSLPSQALAERVHYSKASSAKVTDPVDPALFADQWDREERDGLEHVIHSLAIIGSTEPIDVSSTCIHGRHKDLGVDIAAVHGAKHSDCLEAMDKWASKTHSPVLLISRDRQNTVPLQRELECFADPNHGSGLRITDAQTLLGKARKCLKTELQAFTSELFDVSDRRII